MLAGLVFIVPALVTIWVVRIVFDFLDGWLRPIANHVFGRHIPGVGLLATLLLVYLAGVFATYLAGGAAVRWTERLITRLPLIGDVYGSSRQIMQAVSNPGGLGFKRVVMFEFPRAGVRALGFVTREFTTPEGTRQFAVFMPTTPNPTTGFLLILPPEDVQDTGLSVDEAVKMIVSGGVVGPRAFHPPSGSGLGGLAADAAGLAGVPAERG